MAIALTLQSYLGNHHIAYDVMRHERTANSSRTVETCHISADRMAKGVVIKSGSGYILTILPASRRIAMDAVETITGSPAALATEEEASMLFPDCERGAVPVFGEAYGIPALIEESFDDRRDIFCEGGDHRSLLHMDGRDFRSLMAGAERARIAG